MLRKVLVVAGVGAALLGTLLWQLKGPHDNTASLEPNLEPVPVIAMFPLTGGLASWGESSKNAAILATEEINSNHSLNGKLLKIDFQDHQCDPKVAISILQQEITANQLFITSACSGTVTAIAPILSQHPALAIANVVASGKISNLSPKVFRNWAVETQQAEIFAKYLTQNKVKKLGILYEETDYAKGLKLALEEQLTPANFDIVSESFTTGSTDVLTQISKLKSQKVDSLFISVQSEASADMVLSQLEQLNLNPPHLLFNDIVLNSKSTLAKHSKLVEDAVSTNYSVDPAGSKRFLERYKNRFGNDCPQPNACAAVFDSVMLLAQGISKVGADPTLLQAYLEKINYQGVSGEIGFNQNHDRLKATYSAYQIKNGNAEPLTLDLQ